VKTAQFMNIHLFMFLFVAGKGNGFEHGYSLAYNNFNKSTLISQIHYFNLQK